MARTARLAWWTTTAAAACIVVACGSFSDAPAADDAGSDAAGADSEPVDAAIGADSSRADASGGPVCPSGRGPAMLRMDWPAGAGSYCIDATEVTQAQYKAFLDSSDKPVKSGGDPGFDPICTYGRPSDFAPTTRPSFPISCVDWYDAVAFCSWAGKRLCGDLAGADAAADRDDRSEWFGACSGFGQRAYPWGNEIDRDAGKCNLAADGSVPVGSIATCQGASTGLFDMVGNVREWQADCSGMYCTLRGGGFEDPPDPGDDHDIMHCRAQAFGAPRQDRVAVQGFRCCADLR
jgi:formylglycine-generating enzyme required for sulfatase activity